MSLPDAEPVHYSLKALLGTVTALAVLCAIAAQSGVAGVLLLVWVAWCIASWRTSAIAGLIFLLLGVLILSPVNSTRPPARRSLCANNLKQIAFALHAYHDTYGSFPPAYIADTNGKPMHSWRVLILPFLEQVVLYEAYHFDEPWNGPRNSKLLHHEVDVFRCPSCAGSTTETSYVAVVGPDTAWTGSRCVSLGDITDGPTNTLLVVEVADSGIHWMEPRDIQISAVANTSARDFGQTIPSRHTGGRNVALVDGAIEFMQDSTTMRELRALMTIAGGERVANEQP